MVWVIERVAWQGSLGPALMRRSRVVQTGGRIGSRLDDGAFERRRDTLIYVGVPASPVVGDQHKGAPFRRRAVGPEGAHGKRHEGVRPDAPGATCLAGGGRCRLSFPSSMPLSTARLT